MQSIVHLGAVHSTFRVRVMVTVTLTVGMWVLVEEEEEWAEQHLILATIIIAVERNLPYRYIQN